MTGTTIVRDTLARHRDKPAIGLPLIFPINWQMDDQLAKVLGKDLGLHGSWETWRATPSLGDQIPARSGLYMFVFRSHLVLDVCSRGPHQQTCILYVGQAGDQSSTRTLKDRYKARPSWRCWSRSQRGRSVGDAIGGFPQARAFSHTNRLKF